MTRSKQDKTDLPFEDAMDRLEKLVVELEGGDLPLEQSLERFEQGIRLVRHCSERLRAVEVRIRELQEGPDGVTERPLDGEGG